MEEKLELLPELLTLVDLSKETTSEEASEQADLSGELPLGIHFLLFSFPFLIQSTVYPSLL